MAPEGIGGLGAVVNAISHRECARPIIRWCAVFRFAGGLLLPRHSACSLTIVREPSTEHSRSTLYSGWGFRILDQWIALRAASKAPQRKAVPFPMRSIDPI